MNYRKQQASKLILHMLIMDESCFVRSGVESQDWRYIFNLAICNKLQQMLLHIEDCSTCMSSLPDPFKSKLSFVSSVCKIQTILAFHELKKLRAFARRRDMQIVLLKDPSMGTDLDILVGERNEKIIRLWYEKQGFRRKRRITPKEFTMIHHKTSFEIDVHISIAYPHYGYLPETINAQIHLFSQELMRQIPPGQYVILPTYAFYFISKVIRFWFNDLGSGMRSLMDIADTIHTSDFLKHWSAIDDLAKRHRMNHLLYFVMLVATRIFGESSFPRVRVFIPWQVRLCAAAVSSESVALFPTIHEWHAKKYARWAQRREGFYEMTNVCLRDGMTTLELFRPRILKHLVLGAGAYIKNATTVLPAPL